MDPKNDPKAAHEPARPASQPQPQAKPPEHSQFHTEHSPFQTDTEARPAKAQAAQPPQGRGEIRGNVKDVLTKICNRILEQRFGDPADAQKTQKSVKVEDAEADAWANQLGHFVSADAPAATAEEAAKRAANSDAGLVSQVRQLMTALKARQWSAVHDIARRILFGDGPA